MCIFQLWFPQGICLVVGFLGHTVVLFLVCSGTSILFSIAAVSAYFPTNSAECSLLSASSPALTVCTFSNGDHSDICEVTAHWHVDPVGEGEGWTNWGVRIDMYTLHVQNRKLIGTCREHRHLSLQLCDALEGWDGGSGALCVCVCNNGWFACCTAETNTTL